MTAPDQPADLDKVLEAAASASQLRRIEYRDRIAAFGQAAIDAISPWLSDPQLDHGRPMLSVVVVHKGEQHVGSGFLQLGEELGRKRAVEDDQSFEVRELYRVHDYWRTHADD